jgi:YD repeat-containing protein
MNIKKNSLSTALLTCLLFVWSVRPALAQLEAPQPQLVTNAPAMGTFFVLGRIPSPPFPFDPYQGARPVYAYDGVFFVDGSELSFMEQSFSFEGEEGGGMMLMSSPGPPGAGGSTNSTTNLFCSSLTNFAVRYQYSTNSLSIGIAQTTNTFVVLTIQTATTNASYDVFGTTNLVEMAMPVLSRTNWTWLLRATGAVVNFSWGLTNWCERYFQLGTTNDPDGDSLTSAYESLVSHTNPNDADTDGDGMPDGWELSHGFNPLVDDGSGDADGDGISNADEYRFGLNPALDDAQQAGLFQEFRYDARGRMTDFFVPAQRRYNYDFEGNITGITIF